MKMRTLISWSVLLACVVACSAVVRDVSAARGMNYRGSTHTSQQRSAAPAEEKIPLTDPPVVKPTPVASSTESATAATNKADSKPATPPILTLPAAQPANTEVKTSAAYKTTGRPAIDAANMAQIQPPQIRRLPETDAPNAAIDAPQTATDAAKTQTAMPELQIETGPNRTDESTDATSAPTNVPPAAETTTETETTRPASTDTEPTDAEPAQADMTDAEPGQVSKADAETTHVKKTEVAPVPPVAPARRLSAQQVRLRNKIRTCLAYYYQRPENIGTRSPWGVMHWLIGYGVDAEVIVGDRRANAIGWLCWNQPCRGMQLLSMKGDEIAPRYGPGYQGHKGQLLSMLALSKVKIDYPMKINGKELTVADLVEHEKRTCEPASELSFQLIGLSHYLDSDATWTSASGESWSIPRLIREEIVQPINGACCGGTHRLVGLSTAVRTRAKRNEPMTGEWLRAKNFETKYQRYTLKLQNRDGSISTDWFKGRADSGDVDRKLQTTGHILDWLLYSLPEDQLTDARVVRAVDFLATHMLRNRKHEWEVGPRGHALRALALYGDRVFGDKPGQRRALLARRLTK